VRELVQVSFTDTQKPCGFIRGNESGVWHRRLRR